MNPILLILFTSLICACASETVNLVIPDNCQFTVYIVKETEDDEEIELTINKNRISAKSSKMGIEMYLLDDIKYRDIRKNVIAAVQSAHIAENTRLLNKLPAYFEYGIGDYDGRITYKIFLPDTGVWPAEMIKQREYFKAIVSDLNAGKYKRFGE